MKPRKLYEDQIKRWNPVEYTPVFFLRVITELLLDIREQLGKNGKGEE